MPFGFPKPALDVLLRYWIFSDILKANSTAIWRPKSAAPMIHAAVFLPPVILLLLLKSHEGSWPQRAGEAAKQLGFSPFLPSIKNHCMQHKLSTSAVAWSPFSPRWQIKGQLFYAWRLCKHSDHQCYPTGQLQAPKKFAEKIHCKENSLRGNSRKPINFKL